MDIGYVLVTAAYNEEALLERTIQSVVDQTIRPLRWIVVNDGSTDRTKAIVQDYAAKHSFIRLLNLKKSHGRNFAAQVDAIRAGCAELRDTAYQYIGNLDADITFEPTYFQRLLEKFAAEPKLGLAGGFIYEKAGEAFSVRKRNSVDSVPHAVQMFRRECFEAIGGYTPLRYGGPDWYAEVQVRMLGWRTAAFPELHVNHHRPTGGAEHWHRDRFRQGRMDYALGSHPLFELAKCLTRVSDRPIFLGAFVRAFGFVWSSLIREPRPVSDQFIRHLRKEQLGRMRFRPR